MNTERDERDPFLELAREEAQGTELQVDPSGGGGLEHAREEAQGVEVFEDPDATLPAEPLKEGSPGHESYTEDALGRGGDDEEQTVDESRGR
jgi:hypothetical protein